MACEILPWEMPVLMSALDQKVQNGRRDIQTVTASVSEGNLAEYG